MKMESIAISPRLGATPLVNSLYLLALTLLALTGFGQMPIFKRYYIAQIPGLGWLGDYYLTHAIHYIAAAVLGGIVVYAGVVFIGVVRKRAGLTATGRIKTLLLAGIVITGIFRVLKNLPDFYFSPQFIFLIDLAHLGFVLIFLFTALATMIAGRHWLKSKSF